MLLGAFEIGVDLEHQCFSILVLKEKVKKNILERVIFSRGDLSLKCGDTLSPKSYKPYEDLWEATLNQSSTLVSWIIGINRQGDS